MSRDVVFYEEHFPYATREESTIADLQMPIFHNAPHQNEEDNIMHKESESDLSHL